MEGEKSMKLVKGTVQWTRANIHTVSHTHTHTHTVTHTNTHTPLFYYIYEDLSLT